VPARCTASTLFSVNRCLGCGWVMWSCGGAVAGSAFGPQLLRAARSNLRNWGVAMCSFPTAFGLSPEQVEDVVRSAGAAPSLYNAQPWRFRVLPHLIEVHSDPTRRLPAADPGDQELRLACGAALLNLRLALEHVGVRPVVTLLPRTVDSSALATVRRGGRMDPSRHESLYRAITRRRSNRRPFLPTPVPSGDRHELIQSVQAEQCRLYVVGREELAALEGMVHRAHRIEMADAAFRAEWQHWTGRPSGQTEGVPAAAAGPQPEPQDQWVLRDFSGGQAKPRVPGKDFEYDPLLVVVCSYSHGRLADFQAGQALERMLLTATSLGLAASLIAQVIEVEETREQLQSLLGGGLYPQALVRLGYGSPTPPTPRRPPRDLLISAEPVSTGQRVRRDA
jgi:nitroreductase